MTHKRWWRGNGQGGGLAIGHCLGAALSAETGNWALLGAGLAIGVAMDAAGKNNDKPPEA